MGSQVASGGLGVGTQAGARAWFCEGISKDGNRSLSPLVRRGRLAPRGLVARPEESRRPFDGVGRGAER